MKNFSQTSETFDLKVWLAARALGLRLPLMGVAALSGAAAGAMDELPIAWLCWGVWFLAALLFRRTALLAAAVFSLALYHGAVQLPTRLAPGLARQDLAVTGHIRSLEVFSDRARLRFEIETCRPPDYMPSCDNLNKVRLNWYRPPSLAVGERWQLSARLRPPRGLQNPGAFDYGAWLLQEGFGATGYVREAPAAVRLEKAGFHPRRAAVRLAKARIDNEQTLRWLRALTLGEGSALSDAQWSLLRDTGTTHLAVISGLHVGLVATVTLFLCRALSRLCQPRRWRMVGWPWAVAVLAAVAYAALAGFAPPATRAAIMTTVALWVASGRHAPGAWQAWWLALVIVTLAMPGALWRSGFWLSFGAVAILILAWRWRERPGGLWALLRTQWLLTCGVGAATLVFFAHLAPLGFFINLLAVPWVSFLMVPIALLGWLMVPIAPLSQGVWHLFGLLARAFEAALVWFEGLQPGWQPDAERVGAVAAALLLVCLLSLLPGLALRFRWTAAVLAAGLVLGGRAADGPAPGEVRVLIHDVGQGLLVDIRTASSRWLYDTGPRWRGGFMPIETLWSRPQHFDGVIVSHGDQDHAGGVPVLHERHRVGQWWAPLSSSVEAPAVRACRRGRGWQRDGVRFAFLWPVEGEALPDKRNDRACVLSIRAGEHRVLITGDVGHRVERRLLEYDRTPVALLVAGHHGSHTSSSQALVETLSPERVIYSAGYLNPYGHPADRVVRRFRRAGSCQWSTALDGAVSVSMGRDDVSLVTERDGSGVEDRCAGLESAP